MGEVSSSGWLMKVMVSGFVGRVSDATGAPSSNIEGSEVIEVDLAVPACCGYPHYARIAGSVLF